MEAKASTRKQTEATIPSECNQMLANVAKASQRKHKQANASKWKQKGRARPYEIGDAVQSFKEMFEL